MGAAASSGLSEATVKASPDELQAVFDALDADAKIKVLEALRAAGGGGKAKFCAAYGGGAGVGAGLGCCEENPESYKVLGEIAGARLVQMKLPKGVGDKPHDHPVHYLYVINGGTLKLTPPPGATEGSAEIPLPSGGSMVIPAGPHQVTNVGDTDVEILFVEPAVDTCSSKLDGKYVSPIEICPKCYKKVSEDDSWFVGEMEMEVGEEDPPHSHMDHIVYVLEGDGITIYPGANVEMKKDEATKMVVPIAPGACLPVPAGHHIVKNTGTKKAKMVFFEMKQK